MVVSTSWLAQHLHDPGVVVIYIGRDRQSYERGHIPSVQFIPLDAMAEQHGDIPHELPSIENLKALFESVGISDNSRIVLCGEGGGMLAARAYFTLDYLGLGEHAALLNGGYERWVAEGREVSHATSVLNRGHITPHPHPEILVSLAEMQQLSRQPNGAALLDARSAAEFKGAVASEGVSKPGHIPGATAMDWKSLETGDSELLPRTELAKMFANAGIQPGQKVISYCRTGLRASMVYFVAKYLGHPAAMYDGSVVEWVQKGNDLVTSSQ